MRRNKRVLGVAIGVGALVFAGAAAFTNTVSFSNTNTTVGYGSENVSGATLTSISYGLSTDGTTIDSVTFVASGDTSGSAADVGFTIAGPTNLATTPCGTGVFASGATTYVCNDNGSGLNQSTSTITATDIVVQ
ncbi:MAG TPA: hypothetical protein VNC61_15210 [Acidimicrobiales bacterium]|nr:hypothetical protein [Acidimicrobiales bacterium]